MALEFSLHTALPASSNEVVYTGYERKVVMEPTELTYGSRVKVAPTDLDTWTSDALKAFTGVEGTVTEVSENPFDRKTPSYLVEFDKPVRKWVMLSESEPDTNPANFYTCFHFAGCDLTVI